MLGGVDVGVTASVGVVMVEAGGVAAPESVISAGRSPAMETESTLRKAVDEGRLRCSTSPSST